MKMNELGCFTGKTVEAGWQIAFAVSVSVLWVGLVQLSASRIQKMPGFPEQQ
jgi:hypothetical protein